jgi:hypothetical protein
VYVLLGQGKGSLSKAALGLADEKPLQVLPAELPAELFSDNFFRASPYSNSEFSSAITTFYDVDQ